MSLSPFSKTLVSKRSTIAGRSWGSTARSTCDVRTRFATMRRLRLFERIVLLTRFVNDLRRLREKRRAGEERAERMKLTGVRERRRRRGGRVGQARRSGAKCFRNRVEEGIDVLIERSQITER